MLLAKQHLVPVWEYQALLPCLPKAHEYEDQESDEQEDQEIDENEVWEKEDEDWYETGISPGRADDGRLFGRSNHHINN